MHYLNKFLARVSILPMLLMPVAAGAVATTGNPEGTAPGLQAADENLGQVTKSIASTGDLPTDLVPFIGKLINGALGVLGIFFVILVLYAGFLWMTAGGEDDKVKQSKKLLSQGVIGIVIIVAAYAISRFVIQLVVGAATP